MLIQHRNTPQAPHLLSTVCLEPWQAGLVSGYSVLDMCDVWLPHSFLWSPHSLRAIREIQVAFFLMVATLGVNTAYRVVESPETNLVCQLYSKEAISQKEAISLSLRSSLALVSANVSACYSLNRALLLRSLVSESLLWLLIPKFCP